MPVLAVTPGEPAGIGPDLVVQAVQQRRRYPWAVLADPDLLRARAADLRLPLTLAPTPTCEPGAVFVQSMPLAAPAAPGRLDPANAPAVVSALDLAVRGCLDGRYAALVTGPVQKSLLAESGLEFSGHTEFLRERAGVPEVLMLLVAGGLRVALATTHLPLAAVPTAITGRLLTTRLELLLAGLTARFGIATPTVLVTGLNPHAGESGRLGREELEVIGPVCDAFRSRGADVLGPLPADTAFTGSWLKRADAVFAMYHDQGLPVLKHAGFGRAVNMTLGLPFVRTSVDHGTALDLAGSGRADSGSFEAAVQLAGRLSLPC